MFRIASSIVLLLTLGACGTPRSYLPSSGPGPSAITNSTTGPGGQAVPVIELSEASRYLWPVAPAGASDPRDMAPRGSLASLGGTYDPTRLSAGDVVEVTIFDSGEEGLFSSTDAKSLDLGRFTVDSSGYINLPFAGRQRVAGSSPTAVQTQIVSSLKGSSVNPQAVVSIAEQSGNLVTVDGTVRAPGRFPLTDGKTNVLDVIALAGGAESKPGETTVTVQRGSQRASAGLDQVLASRSQDIALLPDDRIYLSEKAGSGETSFTAYGAFKSAGEFKFTQGQLTLTKAIARAGGLDDDKADPMNVYLFRTQRVAGSVAGGGSYKENVASAAIAPTVPSPIVVHVDMSDPSSFLYMQSFQMQDDDVLYATNAKAVDLAKYLTVLQKSPPLPAAPPPAPSGS